jgi:glycosyltransferase involved in cell wall biosynthesis
MHIAIGYRWFETALGYHVERALLNLRHHVSYIGLPSERRAGYDSSLSVVDVVSQMANPPDLYLWIDPAGRYFPSGIEDLPIPTACYLVDVHLGVWRHQVARFFDAVFVAQKDYVAAFGRTVGHNQVWWLPLAAASDVHRQRNLPRRYDVGFVGNITHAHHGTARARRLDLIAKRFTTNDFYARYSPEDVGRVYSESRIVFNNSIAGDVTMRVFEGTACGALVMTDSIANGLHTLFEIGTEIVTYTDDKDLLDKITFYLAHDAEREQIAQAGRRRTLASHTYEHRTQQLLDRVSDPAFRRLAPMRSADKDRRWQARHKVYTHLHMLDTLLDTARAQRLGLLRRAWAVWPCLWRRLLL